LNHFDHFSEEISKSLSSAEFILEILILLIYRRSKFVRIVRKYAS